jgi:hypothetical protein
MSKFRVSSPRLLPSELNMNEIPENKSGRRRIMRRALIGLAILATLIAIFYAEEDWRGKRAWENCKRDLEAKGMVLDWEKFIPPPVPDDQNFFNVPEMTTWFVKGHGGTAWSKSLESTNTFATISNNIVARDYLAWNDQFEPDFDRIRKALQRPYARMDGDYSQPFEIPIPNFVSMRTLVQVLAQRTKCYLQLGQPDKALRELMLMHDMCRILERPPTGKPITPVEAMINVAITGLFANTIADGLQKHAWQEPQLAALQEQLKKINLSPTVAGAFKMELAGSTRTFETHPAYKLAGLFKLVDLVSGGASSSKKTKAGAFWWLLKNPMYLFLNLAPRGWWYQNLANCAAYDSKSLDGFDLEHDTLSPRLFDEVTHNLNQFLDHKSPFNLMASVAIPNIAKATQTLAHNQTLVNEAQIVCALERYHLAHGEYPEMLDALVPQFIEKLPHDIIGGQPLHYRRTGDGKFLLYSVGWNETDDGGQVVSKPDGSEDWGKGDWVWQYPLK